VAEVTAADAFRAFALSVERDGATTYAAICRSVAEDPELLALMEQAAPAQRRPNLLLAAVHYLLLGGTDGGLARHYDTVSPPAAGDLAPGDPVAGDLATDFKSFCLDHSDALLELIATRSTQTNEVGRCAALFPALCVVAQRYGLDQPISLLDLGASAGLNMLFDHFRYLYRDKESAAVVEAGQPESPVMLECRVRTGLAQMPTLVAPPVAARIGLDADPIDATSDDGARWLLACLWPDNLTRFTRMKEALQIARAVPAASRPHVLAGDIVDDLAKVADTIDSDYPLVVFHSWVAAYLSEDRQRQLVVAVRDLALRRRLHYLYAESPVETPGLPTPLSPQPRPTSDLATALVHLDLDPASAHPHEPVRLADLHPHGSWLSWWR
jgi:hypothetical protein